MKYCYPCPKHPILRELVPPFKKDRIGVIGTTLEVFAIIFIILMIAETIPYDNFTVSIVLATIVGLWLSHKFEI
jgi:hypothetical protein